MPTGSWEFQPLLRDRFVGPFNLSGPNGIPVFRKVIIVYSISKTSYDTQAHVLLGHEEFSHRALTPL